MSISNIKRQRQFTFKIVAQLVISTVMMAGPSTYFTISGITGWQCSFIYVFNNLFVLLLGTHPFVSSIYTLFAWTNYRQYFADLKRHSPNPLKEFFRFMVFFLLILRLFYSARQKCYLSRAEKIRIYHEYNGSIPTF
ncbi:unnamed protein product [Auanema sp. JU1783]|nr:unnamed protein product [Auanema sp. JU1783]